MTLREAMKLLDLNERTLDISMLESAARRRMNEAQTNLEHDQVLEAYRRVQIFLDPSADERFSMRGPNVLAALSETREYAPIKNEEELDVVLVDDESDVPVPASSQLVFAANEHPSDALSDSETVFDLELELDFPTSDLIEGALEFASAPEVPSLAASEVPSLAVPEVPSLAVPEVPSLAVPEVPSLAVPEVFYQTMSEVQPIVPAVQNLVIPETYQPLELESAQLFSTPMVDAPSVPMVDAPSVPAIQPDVRTTAELPLTNHPVEENDWSNRSSVWTAEASEFSHQAEFDDSLLIPAPRVVSDETALTIIEDEIERPIPMPKTPVIVAATEPKKLKTTASSVPIPTAKTGSPPASGNAERRVSRAAQVSGVNRAYETKKKSSNQPPLWALLLAVATVVGTGIFAAPMFFKQISGSADTRSNDPSPNLSVPTLPQAPVKPVVKPAVKPTPKPSATKPNPNSTIIKQPKPNPKPNTQPKPSTSSPKVVNQVTKPTPVVQTKDVQPAQPAVARPTPKPVVKPTITPKPTPAASKPKDPRSADILPPIGSAPKPKPVVKPAPKPTVAKPTPKPTVAKPAPKPAPKPAAPSFRIEEPAPAPTPTPAVQTPAPAEAIDPNNLTREQIGRRFLNEKYYADWLSRGAQLKYPSWADVPIAVQVLAFGDFRSAVLIALP